MNRFVANLNIEHYREALANEMDEAKRRTLARLLAEEEAKLAALDKRNRQKKASSLSNDASARVALRPTHAFLLLPFGGTEKPRRVRRRH
jgi:hypothetical protein